MTYLTGSCRAASEILEALGVPCLDVVGFTLRVRAGEIVTIEVERYLHDGVDVDVIKDVLKVYQLVEAPDGSA
jgi:hypothetical protein